MVNLSKQFNNILLDLLSQVPLENTALVPALNSVLLFDENIAVEHFIKHGLPVKDKIMERDEAYFADQAIDNIIDEYSMFDIKDVTDEIKNIYFSSTKKTQGVIWDYIQSLLYIGEEYNNSNN